MANTIIPPTVINGGAVGTSLGYNGTYTTAENWGNTSNYTIADNVLKVNGNPATLEVKGKLVVNGLDLEERLKTIEYVLGLPERDATIEAKYPSLKKKYDEYVKALAKYRTFEALKGESE